MLKDDVLARTLIAIYLSPLDDLRVGGMVARETLRTYFITGCNGDETADRPKVNRRTIWRQLDKISEGLACSSAARGKELEVAFRLEALEDEARKTGRTSAA